MSDPSEFSDNALERYRAAHARAVQAREEWEKAGSPITIVHPNSTEGIHPRLKAVQDAETHADRLMRTLGLVPRGRPTGSNSAPDRTTKLRRLK